MHSKAQFVYCALLLATTGCSRTQYRLEADSEAYSAIAERNDDPRWSAADYSIEMDRRSRYFDTYDPDRSQMPKDDPASHAYMHRVNGKRGWEHWHDNGVRSALENPDWRDVLGQYVEIGDDGSVNLDVNSALRLAYVHSPLHQRQLETLYLSALDVTGERFDLDTQYFSGYDLVYNHNGRLGPAVLVFDEASGKFEVRSRTKRRESNRFTLGNPPGGSSAAQIERRFATAGQLLAAFANSFVFEFTGGDANLSASLARFSLIQPLLRGAGRDIALKRLTQSERSLLANLRAYSQFRQGYYTQVAIGELGVDAPQRGRRGTSITSFSSPLK